MKKQTINKSENNNSIITIDEINTVYTFHKYKIRTFLTFYMNYLMYTVARQVELDKKESTRRKSNIKSPSTFSLTNTIYSMYLTSSSVFSVKSIEYKNQKEKKYDKQDAIDKMLNILDFCQRQDDTKREEDRTALDSILCGVGFIEVLHKDNIETIESLDKKTGGIKKTEIINSYETLKYISVFNMILPLSIKDMSSSKYNIVRDVMKIGDFIQYYSGLYKNFKCDKDKILSNSPIETKDWDMVVAYMMFANVGYKSGIASQITTNPFSNSDGGSYQYQDFTSDNSFQIGEDFIEVFKVETDTHIQLFANQIDCGIYPRIGSRKKRSQKEVKFKNSLHPIYGMGVGYLALPYQEMQDIFLNLKMDIAKLTASAPVLVSASERGFDGKNVFEFNPDQLIKVEDPTKSMQKMQVGGDFNTADASFNSLVQLVQNTLGLTGYSLGQQQKVERVARGIQAYIDAADRSFKEFLGYWSDMKSFVSKMWIINAIEYMDDQTMIKICGDLSLKDIPIQDIIQDFSFTFDLQLESSIRDAMQLEIAKEVISDLLTLTNEDGSPLLDRRKAAELIIDKSGVELDLLYTPEEAIEFAKEQIKKQKEIEDYKKEIGLNNEGVTQNTGNQEISGLGSLNSVMKSFGVQGGGLPGQSSETNPNGIIEDIV